MPPSEPIPNLIQRTLENTEPDIRAALLANVVLTGGGSLMQGMSDRIFNELQKKYPAVSVLLAIRCRLSHLTNALTLNSPLQQKVKLHAPGNPIERRYGAWLGGSIIASLGTFHQLWISAEEYQVCLCYPSLRLPIPLNKHPLRNMAQTLSCNDVNNARLGDLSLNPCHYIVIAIRLNCKGQTLVVSDLHPCSIHLRTTQHIYCSNPRNGSR